MGAKMFRSFLIAMLLMCCAANSVRSETILCPKQKEPTCQDILPAQEISCDRAACNVAKNSEGGRTSCLWTCAAHFENFSINGVPLQSLLDALKKTQQQ
jgi:hypothetical protein